MENFIDGTWESWQKIYWFKEKNEPLHWPCRFATGEIAGESIFRFKVSSAEDWNKSRNLKLRFILENTPKEANAYFVSDETIRNGEYIEEKVVFYKLKKK